MMLVATIRTYKKAYTGLSKETWLLSLIMLINRSGTMVIPFMTLYLTTALGYSISKAGFVFALFGAGAFAGAWLGGKLTDRIGFYPVQLFTLFVGGILFFILGQMHTYPLICLFTFLLSFINEAFRPANSTAIAFYSKEANRTRSYALNRLAINLGWALGSSIGGMLAHLNYQLLFWVDGITNIIAALIMLVFLKPLPLTSNNNSLKTSSPTLSPWRDKKFIQFVLLTILFASCFFQLFTNLPVFFKKELHLSEKFIGFIMAANGLIIASVEMVIIYKLEGKRNILTYISIGVLLICISFLLLNLPLPAKIVAISMIMFVTFGEILSMPFMNTYWIKRTQANNRGQYAAMYTMAWSVAQTIGPMLGARLADSAGFDCLWYSISFILLFTAWAFSKQST
jgi:predicted MFS family arabinose efflux permease